MSLSESLNAEFLTQTLQAQCLLNLSGDAVVMKQEDSMLTSSGSPQQAVETMKLISIPDSPQFGPKPFPARTQSKSEKIKKKVPFYHVTEL